VILINWERRVDSCPHPRVQGPHGLFETPRINAFSILSKTKVWFPDLDPMPYGGEFVPIVPGPDRWALEIPIWIKESFGPVHSSHLTAPKDSQYSS